MKLESSRSVTTTRTGHARRNLAVTVIATIAVVACASTASDEPSAADVADSALPARTTEEPAPTQPVTTSPTVRALFGDSREQFDPGTYFVDNFEGTPTAPVNVTLGAGWSNDFDGWSIKNTNGGYLTFNRPDDVFSDACHPSDGYHPGPVTTLDGLVAALSKQEGWIEVTIPSDISIDGYTGTTLQRTSPANLSKCTRGLAPDNRLYPLFPSWENTFEGGTRGWSYYEAGTVETLYVLDLDDTIVILSIRASMDEPASAHAELAAVLDSVRIDPK